jgi:uncharacterized protein YlxW (UPF0749 family)
MTGTQIMVVLIVAIVMFASIVRSKHAYGPGRGSRRRGREEALVTAGAEDARLHAEVAELKKRLAVLERITVEKENSLERQIEALRDR